MTSKYATKEEVLEAAASYLKSIAVEHNQTLGELLTEAHHAPESREHHCKVRTLDRMIQLLSLKD